MGADPPPLFPLKLFFPKAVVYLKILFWTVMKIMVQDPNNKI